MNTKELKALCCSMGAGLLLSACVEAPSAPAVAGQQAAAQAGPVTKTCQSDYSTGSHYNRTVECVTDEERDQEEQQTKQQMDTFRALSSATSAH